MLRALQEISQPASQVSKVSPPFQPSGRELSRVADVRKFLSPSVIEQAKTFGILDVGSSEGKITAALAVLFGLPKALVRACDVVQQPDNPAFTFTRTEPGKVLPYPDGSIGVVFAMMSAHHFAPWTDFMFGEMRRVLVPGGYLIMREHDCTSPGQALYYDLVHKIYGIGEDPPEVVVSSPQYSGAYRSAAAWKRYMGSKGFKVISSLSKKDKFDSFYLLAQKPTLTA